MFIVVPNLIAVLLIMQGCRKPAVYCKNENGNNVSAVYRFGRRYKLLTET